jgi:hypothetical protein
MTSERTLQASRVAIVTSLCTYVGVSGYTVDYMQKRLMDIRPKKGTPSWLQWTEFLRSHEAMNVGAWWVYKGRSIRNTQQLKWVPALVTSKQLDKYLCALFVDSCGKIHKPNEGCGLSIQLNCGALSLQHHIPVDLTRDDVDIQVWFGESMLELQTRAQLDVLCKEHHRICIMACPRRTVATHTFVQTQDMMVANTTCKLSMVNKAMYRLFGFCVSKDTAVQQLWMCLSANGSAVKASTTTTSIYSNLSGCRRWSQLKAWKHANETHVYVPVCTFQYHDKCVQNLDNNAMLSNFVAYQAHSSKKRKRNYSALQQHFIYLCVQTHYPLNKSGQTNDTQRLFELVAFYLSKALATTPTSTNICKVFDLEEPATSLQTEISTWFTRLMQNDVAHAHLFKLMVIKDGKMVKICDPSAAMQHMLTVYKMHIASALHQRRQHISAFGPYLGRHVIDNKPGTA